MKINFGNKSMGQEEPEYLKNYLYEDYEPVKSSYSAGGHSKKSKGEYKWILQLMVSALILAGIVGLFKYNLPFTEPLRSAVRYLMNTEADIEPVFHKILQLAAQTGNMDWPLVDDVPGQGTKVAAENKGNVGKEGTSGASKVAEADKPAETDLQVILPVSGKVVGVYGWAAKPGEEIQAFNEGIDIEVPLGTDVKASSAGTVLKTGEDAEQGKYVIIKTASGMLMRYSNLSEIEAAKGEKVELGEVIAKSGTNIDKKPNLHFEVIVNGKPVNPLEQLGIDTPGSSVKQE